MQRFFLYLLCRHPPLLSDVLKTLLSKIYYILKLFREKQINVFHPHFCLVFVKRTANKSGSIFYLRSYRVLQSHVLYSKGVFEIQTDRFFKQGLVRIKERFRTKVYLFAFKRLQS
jgi:hypothetical protein